MPLPLLEMENAPDGAFEVTRIVARRGWVKALLGRMRRFRHGHGWGLVYSSDFWHRIENHSC
jgi:hypothetical protein